MFIVIFYNSRVALAAEPTISYRAHVQNIGWQNYVIDGQMAGTEKQALRMEAIQISLQNPLPNMKISYQVHVENIGWMNYVDGGNVAGTTGRNLRVEAIKIRLENAPTGYHIEYQTHVQNIGWQGFVRDGAISGTTGKSLRIEAIKIRIVRDSSLVYSAHVQNIGWQNDIASPNTVGSAGSGLRLEAIKLNLTNFPSGSKVKYQSHVENIGWQNWVENGQVSGTTGQALRIEGMRIKLEGCPDNYHILYRSYVQGYGWQNWVKDGEISGIVARALRIEAIEVKIVTGNDFANYTKPKISVDIGHNAPPYDVGSNGIRQESEMTKEVGDKVIQKLKDRGYNVIPVNPTRTATSEHDSLQQRTEISNSNESNLFVSIHFNLFNGDAHGSEVYFMKTGSKPYAERIVNNLSSLGFTNRGAKYDNTYYVLKNTNCDAILVEGCFDDSQTDMKIYNPENIANAIVNGLIN